MTALTWTPESILFLALIVMAIVILVLGEIIEARRERRAQRSARKNLSHGFLTRNLTRRRR